MADKIDESPIAQNVTLLPTASSMFDKKISLLLLGGQEDLQEKMESTIDESMQRRLERELESFLPVTCCFCV